MGKFLLVAEVYSNNQLDELKSLTQKLDETYELNSISSVYEVIDEDLDINTPRSSKMHSGGLCVIYSLEASQKVEEISLNIEKIRKGIQEEFPQCDIKAELLLFDNHSIMRPSLTLPNPSLHKKREWLIPAAELWPDYLHPVLEESLEELARENFSGRSDFFFAQGKRLLDF